MYPLSELSQLNSFKPIELIELRLWPAQFAVKFETKLRNLHDLLIVPMPFWVALGGCGTDHMRGSPRLPWTMDLATHVGLPRGMHRATLAS